MVDTASKDVCSVVLVGVCDWVLDRTVVEVEAVDCSLVDGRVNKDPSGTENVGSKPIIETKNKLISKINTKNR